MAIFSGSKATRNAAVAASFAAAFAIALGAASAQDGEKPAAPAAADQPETTAVAKEAAWVKVCGEDPKTKKEVCVVAQEIRAETGQFLASIAVREIKGEKQKVLSVFVPTIMLLQPGLRVQVDEGKQMPGKYAICFPDRCYAEIPVADDFVDEMKKGNEMTVTTLNQQARGVAFKLTLTGFTKAFDGPPMDTKELEAQQKMLQDELQKAAEKERQKLMDEQGGKAPAQ